MVSRPRPDFSRLLEELRIKSGKTRYKLAQYSGLDESYILRLETGERCNPSRDTVEKLCLALVSGSTTVPIDDVNRLRLAAGYAPLRTRGQGFWEI